MTRVVLVGAAGRMGRAVAAALAGAADLTLAARVDVAGVPAAGDGGAWTDDPASVVAAGDVVVEFTTPPVAVAVAALCAGRGAALVSGTTGLDAGGEQAMQNAAARVAVVRSANFSLGVLALRRAMAAALASLPGDWDVEIVERHHRGKLDAPSGTALLLAREAARQRGWPEAAVRTGRAGRGARPGEEIGVHALRGGTWIGDHAVVFAGTGESVELRHVAEDRAAFAQGVVAAIRFVTSAPPGLYTLDQVASAGGRSTG